MAALVVFGLVACGGGGGSSSSLPTTSGGSTGTTTNTPTPTSSATPAPTSSSTPAPTASSAPAPTTVVDSTTPAVSITLSASQVIGSPAPQMVASMPNSATTSTGITCQTADNDNDYHAQVSMFVNGSQMALPTGIGLYGAYQKVAPYYYEVDSTHPGSCYFGIHVHTANGALHVSPQLTSSGSNRVFTLGDFFDLWGQTPTASGFDGYSGTTTVYDTDESTGSVGSYHVTNITGIDPHTIPLAAHHVYTIEVGTLVDIPNYTFDETSL